MSQRETSSRILNNAYVFRWGIEIPNDGNLEWMKSQIQILINFEM